MPTKVCAVIVNYNGFADTIECLHSFKEQQGSSCRLLVVDNASNNDSVARICAAHPDVEIITTHKNLGFTGGNNVGIRHALAQGCDYLFLVNNDTVMEPDCLSHLLMCAQQHPEAAVVSPAMYYYHDRTRPWFTGSAIDNVEGTYASLEGPVDAAVVTAVPWATGCAMLIPVEKMREIGGFDERFFCYYEDVDWSLRAREKNSTCVLCPAAVLYHKVAASSGGDGKPRLDYYNTRNHLLCLSKHASGQNRRRLLRLRTWRAMQTAKHLLVKGTVPNRKRRALAHLVGVVDFYRCRFGPWSYRWLD